MMSSYTPRNVLLLAVLYAVVAISTQHERINCRKFVFAPICRGVAAKRSGSGPVQDEDTSRMLHSMMPQRTGSDSVNIPEVSEPFVTPSSEEADTSMELTREILKNRAYHRAQRNRKAYVDVPARHLREGQAFYRVYLPRVSTGAVQPDYELY